MILSDITIKKLCENSGFIENFEGNQVSEKDGRKVISYGLSSYGYDARIGNEFWIYRRNRAATRQHESVSMLGDTLMSDGSAPKVKGRSDLQVEARNAEAEENRNSGAGPFNSYQDFLNSHEKDGICIDPKNPDHEMMEKIETNDPFFIEPHGFILGLTVEKFRLPNDVLAVCIGKSTYARCGLIVNVTPVEPGCEGRIVIEVSNTTNLPVKIYPNEGICQFLFFKGDSVCETSYKKRSGKYMNQNEIILPHVK